MLKLTASMTTLIAPTLTRFYFAATHPTMHREAGFTNPSIPELLSYPLCSLVSLIQSPYLCATVTYMPMSVCGSLSERSGSQREGDGTRDPTESYLGIITNPLTATLPLMIGAPQMTLSPGFTHSR